MAVSFTYDGVPASEFGIYLSQSHRRLHGSTRERRVTIPGKAGQYDAGSEPDIRQIELDLTMLAPDRRTLVENLHAFAALMEPTLGYRQLIFDDDPERCLFAKLVGDVPNDNVMLFSTFTITVQSDPYYYDLEPTSFQWNAAGGDTVMVENQGTAPSPLLIQVSANQAGTHRGVAAGLGGVGNRLSALSAPVLTVNGTSVGYDGQLLPGNEIVFDTGAFSCELDGDPSAINGWTGEMPLMPAGDVTLTEQDGRNVGATVILTWTPRYF